MAVLLSPVAWIHHLHWMVVVLFAVLGPDPLRDRRRLGAAAVLTAWFLARGPWWGITWVSSGWQPMLVGRFLQNSDTVGALLALGVLGWTLARPAGGRAGQPDRNLVDHAR